MNITEYSNTGISRGFTIVELMITIVVIAILAAITVIAYTNVQERARISTAQSDLRQLGTIAELYRLDNGKYPNNVTSIGGALDEHGGSGSPLGRESIDIDNRRNLYCIKDDGSDLWISADRIAGTVFAHTSHGLPYWQGSTGSIGAAPFDDPPGDMGQTRNCNAITGGEHDHTIWSSSAGFQEQLGRG